MEVDYSTYTSQGLLSSAYNCLTELETLEDNPEREAELNYALSEIYIAMEQKVDSYDSFIEHLELREAEYKGAKNYFASEAKRMSTQLNRLATIRDRFYKFIMPQVIENLGDGEKFETAINTFKFAKKYSALQVENPDLIPSRYKIEQPPKIDGRLARKDAIQAHKDGTKIEGMHVLQERYVKKS